MGMSKRVSTSGDTLIPLTQCSDFVKRRGILGFVVNIITLVPYGKSIISFTT